jgi:hypothetical protein
VGSDKQLTPEQIAFNQTLWHWFPLGQVDAIWILVEHLSCQIDGMTNYPEEIEAVFGALQKLDERIRADRYPFPKKKVKQSNGQLLPKSKNRRKR